MNYELIALIAFIAAISLFLIIRRKKVEVQKMAFPVLYFILYKTKLGLKAMENFAKRKTFMKVFSISAVILGFVGMAAICVLLVYNLYKIALFPSAVSGVGLVLPIKAKGVFYVPFFYWIISILIVASVHEFCHGMVARFHNIKVKSSGFAFLAIFAPIIPAAFVEPDEKQLKKKKTRQQLEVFAAGPFSNIVFGFIFLGLFLLIASPVASDAMNFRGANITSISNSSVLFNTSIKPGDTILKINNANVTFVEDLQAEMQNLTSGKEVLLETDRGNYSVILGASAQNQSQAYLGVMLAQNKAVKPEVIAKYGSFLPNAVVWIIGLLWWLYVLNLGIGIFNLVPVGPIDGGRMIQAYLLKKYRKEQALKIANWISMVFLAIIVLNVVAGFVI